MPTRSESARPLQKTAEKCVVLASSNPGKLREISELTQGLKLKILPQSEFNIADAEESGLTFVENAILKARNAAHYSGLPALADDSGLEVDALHGTPGIYSSRYAGIGASDADNVGKLLADLVAVPEYRRSARFQCIMVYMAHASDPTPVICQGTWEGSILFAPRGTNGFGYDPIFYVPTHHCSSAELPAEVKNLLSHRGQALRKMVEQLQAGVLSSKQ